MIKLKKVKIEKYKCIETTQEFGVDDKITVLVGMNESGKTSILEALAKSNYFEDDKDFKFNTIHDYPRKEKKQLDKSGDIPIAIVCYIEINKELLDIIYDDIGKKSLIIEDFNYTTYYNNNVIYNDISINFTEFVNYKCKELNIQSKELKERLNDISSNEQLETIIKENEENKEIVSLLKKLQKYFVNEGNLDEPLKEYIIRNYIQPNLPKFLYYSEYYNLQSDLSIEKINRKELDDQELKTAKALLELADINLDELTQTKDYENYKAELEATQSIISEEIFKYWSTNKNIDIEFDIEPIIVTNNTPQGRKDQIVEHILKIRVKNQRSKVSLPLKNRSKGFIWFFSFLVWFKKIQEDKHSNYILLLDEPGLNLHAKAQDDLLRFLEDLSKEYQIIYTTHSPFMIDSSHLDRVRTIVETKSGAIISDSVQEKDANTLFPLQAALGYDIAQNLFISKKNLLVEGVSDLIYLNVFSSILESQGKEGLKNGITIVPVGGLDKVATFISLLRGSELNIVCLLDSFIDPKGKARMDDLIKDKIIKSQFIKFYDEFTTLKKADIEDLMGKEEYLILYNGAFKNDENYNEINLSDLNSNIKNIVIQINQFLNVERFNHYRPANYLVGLSNNNSFFSKGTLDTFENVFRIINKLFS